MDVERKGPQVLDLSRSARSGPALQIEASAAAEVLMSLFLMTGNCDFATYDLPTERLEEIKSSVAADLRADLDELATGSEVMAQVIGFVSELDPPRDVAALVAHLAAADPVEIQLALLGYYQHPHPEAPPALIRAVAGGDEHARAALVRAAAGYPDWFPQLDNLLQLGPDRIKQLLLSILPRWHEEVWPGFGIDMGALEADAEAKRGQARTVPLDQLIETATNGFQYTYDPRTRRILLFPSAVLKPWMVHHDHKDQKILCYPVPDEPAAPGTMTTTQLARFYKALGDEGRLRLLQRLARGSLTLSAAAEELGVAKSTAHHHLGLLRHAGLVLIREENTEKTWTLRRDLLPQAGEILNDFLGRG
ncbi:MAG TPA: helix-turn-helix domain-containing protein [Actinomycetota bacterium]|nr:helix-turn-helix domain-containing protein [Actinomycetota bacterium]